MDAARRARNAGAQSPGRAMRRHGSRSRRSSTCSTGCVGGTGRPAGSAAPRARCCTAARRVRRRRAGGPRRRRRLPERAPRAGSARPHPRRAGRRPVARRFLGLRAHLRRAAARRRRDRAFSSHGGRVSLVSARAGARTARRRATRARPAEPRRDPACPARPARVERLAAAAAADLRRYAGERSVRARGRSQAGRRGPARDRGRPPGARCRRGSPRAAGRPTAAGRAPAAAGRRAEPRPARRATRRARGFGDARPRTWRAAFSSSPATTCAPRIRFLPRRSSTGLSPPNVASCIAVSRPSSATESSARGTSRSPPPGPIAELAAEVSVAAAQAAGRGAPETAVELADHALRLTPRNDPDRGDRTLELAGYLEVAGEKQRLTDLLLPALPSLPPGQSRVRACLLLTSGEVAGNDDIRRFLELALLESGSDAISRAAVLAEMAANDAGVRVERIAEAEASALEACRSQAVPRGTLVALRCTPSAGRAASAAARSTMSVTASRFLRTSTTTSPPRPSAWPASGSSGGES